MSEITFFCLFLANIFLAMHVFFFSSVCQIGLQFFIFLFIYFSILENDAVAEEDDEDKIETIVQNVLDDILNTVTTLEGNLLTCIMQLLKKRCPQIHRIY